MHALRRTRTSEGVRKGCRCDSEGRLRERGRVVCCRRHKVGLGSGAARVFLTRSGGAGAGRRRGSGAVDDGQGGLDGPDGRQRRLPCGAHPDPGAAEPGQWPCEPDMRARGVGVSDGGRTARAW
eukprot:2919513-Rhodomonas_salina.1